MGGGGVKGLKGLALEGIERIEREEEERQKAEEERRGNKVEALPNRNRDQSLCCFLFCVLRVTVG